MTLLMIEFMLWSVGLLGILLFVDTIVPNSLICQAASGNNAVLVQNDLWYLLVFFLLLGISWFLAQRAQDLGTINGCGIKMFGHAPSGQGYFATKWICVFFLAILPVASYEVLVEDRTGIRHIMNRLDAFLWPQILLTLTKTFLILIVCLAIPILIFNLDCFLRLPH